MHQFNQVVLGALDIAQSIAIENKNSELLPIHLLYGLIKNPASFSSQSLKKYMKDVKNELDKVPTSSKKVSIEGLRPSAEFSGLITSASARAVQAGRQEISEGDILRYLPECLKEISIDPNDLKTKVDAEGEEEEIPSFLDNLNEMAISGKLDPVIGRTIEIRSVMEILGRRNKNNPVLVGAAGVGKTAIVEGLSDLIVKNKVPDQLKGKTVFALNMGALMAGTKFRGEFEEKIQKLLKFMKNQNGDAILFIDEIHLIVGAGKTDGAMDAANLLKPALARGELHCIGATTPEEYQKYILSDSALDRRFRNVPVQSPTTQDAVEILMGIKEKQEIHHGIKISDDAIYQAVLLSEQYITDKNLPDKAIDLIDEASSALKLSAEAMPIELSNIDAEIRSKMILSQVEKNNTEILKEVEVLKGKFEAGKKKWEEDVLSLKKISDLKSRIDKLKFELESHERNQNYEAASKIKYSLIPDLEKELSEIEYKNVLQVEHVAEVISRQTGIPLEKILQSKQDKILKLNHYLKGEVYGQDFALDQISATILSAVAGLTDSKRPLGSFLLLGPTGVGKTETVKAVARFLFNSEKSIIRLDMSEYSEKHSVAKLIGAPAGYVGYDDGGILTNAVRKRPYSVILFDEIEKAHPDFADILLQILDDGRLTDNKGRTIDFKNTIIFMTSNSKNIEIDFKPEVLGRIDEKLSYHKIDKTIVRKLLEREIINLNNRIKNKDIKINYDDSIMKEIEKRGYDEEYGARPLKTAFNRLVIRPLSSVLLQGTNNKNLINVKYENDATKIELT